MSAWLLAKMAQVLFVIHALLSSAAASAVPANVSHAPSLAANISATASRVPVNVTHASLATNISATASGVADAAEVPTATVKMKSKTGGYAVDPRGVLALKEEHRPRYSTSQIDYGPFVSTRWVRLPVDLSALNEGTSVGDVAKVADLVRSKLGLKAPATKKKKSAPKMCPCGGTAAPNGTDAASASASARAKTSSPSTGSAKLNATHIEQLCPCPALAGAAGKAGDAGARANGGGKGKGKGKDGGADDGRGDANGAKTSRRTKAPPRAPPVARAASTREEAALLLSQGATFAFLAESMRQFGFNVSFVAAIPPAIAPNGDLTFSTLVTEFRASTFGDVERAILAAALSTRLNLWDDQVTIDLVTDAAEPPYLSVLRGLLRNSSLRARGSRDEFVLHREAVSTAASAFGRALTTLAAALHGGSGGRRSAGGSAAAGEAPSVAAICAAAGAAAETSKHLERALDGALELALVRPRSGEIYGEARTLSFDARRSKEQRIDAEQLLLRGALRRALLDGASKAKSTTDRSVRRGTRLLRVPIIGEPPLGDETSESVRVNASALLRVVHMAKAGVFRHVPALSFNMSGATRALQRLQRSTASLGAITAPRAAPRAVGAEEAKGAGARVPLSQVADALDYVRADALALQSALPSSQTDALVASADMLFNRLSKSSGSVNGALRSALFGGGGGAPPARVLRRRRLSLPAASDSAEREMSALRVSLADAGAAKGSPQSAALSRIPFVRRLVKGVHVTAVVNGVAPPVDDGHAKLMIEAAYVAAGKYGVQVQTLVRAATSAWGGGGRAPAAKTAGSGTVAAIAGLRGSGKGKRTDVGGALQVVHFISRFSERDFEAADRLTYTLGLENYLRSSTETSVLSTSKVRARIVGVASGVLQQRVPAVAMEKKAAKTAATTKEAQAPATMHNATRAAGGLLLDGSGGGVSANGTLAKGHGGKGGFRRKRKASRKGKGKGTETEADRGAGGNAALPEMRAALAVVIAPRERARSRAVESDSPYHEDGGVVVAVRIRGMSSSELDLAPGALSPTEAALARVLRSAAGGGGGVSRGDATEGAETGGPSGLGAAESDATLLLRQRLQSAQLRALHEIPTDDAFGWEDAQAVAIIAASVLITLTLFSQRNPCRALLPLAGAKKARPRRIQNALGATRPRSAAAGRGGRKRRRVSPLAIVRQLLRKVAAVLRQPLGKVFKCNRDWRCRKRKRTSTRKRRERREQRSLAEVRETRGSTNSTK